MEAFKGQRKEFEKLWCDKFWRFFKLFLWFWISPKKRNSHGHFKCINEHKIIPTSCCLIAVMLFSPKSVSFFMHMFHCGIILIFTQYFDRLFFIQLGVLLVSKLTNLYKWLANKQTIDSCTKIETKVIQKFLLLESSKNNFIF